MPVFRLDERLRFPDPSLAGDDGLLAVGGDLRPERLVLAYQHGIFPWYDEGMPILWHSPAERWVLRPAAVRLGRTARKELRRMGEHEVRFDTAFDAVIRACSRVSRVGQDGTWITAEMVTAYRRLAALGMAHSAEVWSPDGALVGGLYGVSLGGAFFGESMFQRQTGASKAALAALCRLLSGWSFDLIDAQVHTPLLERVGAQPMSRAAFRRRLANALTAPTRRGPWRVEGAPEQEDRAAWRVRDVLTWHDRRRSAPDPA
jgi:leucyl/phenylalanyl-tRNA--protein transferase